MRVLMVSDVFFPRVNGVSTSIETFRHTLVGQGVEVRVVAPRYGDEPDDPHVARVPGRPVPRDPEDRLVAWRAMTAAVRAQAAACDLIHIQTPFAAHYAGLREARRAGVPVLATYHTLFEEYLHHYAPFLPAAGLRAAARLFSRRQCNALDGVVVPSTAMHRRLADYGVRQPIHVLPTGIPLSRFAGGDRARFRAAHGIRPGRPVALFVGRVAHEKNIGFLLEMAAQAVRRCPDLLLIVAGEGPALPALREQAAQLGLGESVRFTGYLDRHRDLPDCYAAADVFVFASRTETQGLVLLEAMAVGLPVVALAYMGTVDILAPRRGCRVPDDDPACFAAAVVEVLADPALRSRLGSEAWQYARGWSDEAMAQRMAELYRAYHNREIIAQWKAHTKARPA
ncbi:MAG: glycosyltransferase [Rhodocyclaceae bacterium]|jgi:glycosyltransferase involved in cell wall biosynthesis|nr:D-inositol-3-phosphate glycosyltransferase [Rhodocyclaceae bacterium]MCC6878708.1 glycosyltransferase [Rhodocyclaceae bacterium]